MASVGLALGAGGAVLAVSMVQAGDDAGIRAFHQQEAANAQRPRRQHVAQPHRPSPMRPAATGWSLPLLQTQPDGRIAHPPIALNPFARAAGAEAGRSAPNRGRSRAARSPCRIRARSICVRLCDGFHAPIGLVRTNSDMKAHEALCQAMNPGVPGPGLPRRAGRDDDRRGADARRQALQQPARRLQPSKKPRDPACRPAIVQEGERRSRCCATSRCAPATASSSTARSRTFVGGSRWPYSPRDFRDFRSAAELSKGQRKEIDDRVGLSRMEAEARVSAPSAWRCARRACRMTASPATPCRLRGLARPRERSGPVRLDSARGASPLVCELA